MAKRRPIISTVFSHANPARHPHLRSASSSIAALETARTSGMNSRLKTPKSPVRARFFLFYTLFTDPAFRRDRTDDQGSQVCVGAYRQHYEQNTTEQASAVILEGALGLYSISVSIATACMLL